MMHIDLSQFNEVFFEESFEGLDAMESDLLELESGDEETINAIFRAAHSIKGGAGMFGFSAVQDFTHLVETLLDEMRDGRRSVNRELVNLLLKSADCIRDLLNAAKDGNETPPEEMAQVQQQLTTLLELPADDDPEVLEVEVLETAAADEQGQGWHICFKPFANMLVTCNEPLRMFDALSELGVLSVCVDSSLLPDLEQLDPESCYLTWELDLQSSVELDEVEAVFEWVEGDCELEITPLQSVCTAEPQPSEPSSESDAQSVTSDVQSRTERRSGDRRIAADSGSIRVSTDKVDALINRVGELVITQSMLGQIGLEADDFDLSQLELLKTGLIQLERNTRELQEDVMRVRMLPIGSVFNRFPRLVRDLQEKLGKKIELQMSGEQTELDKTLMERISDPLVHLVRNAIDHGIEEPQRRIAAGKPEFGRLTLNAFHQGGNITIEIQDDGQGLDAERIVSKARENGLLAPGEMPDRQQIYDLIFHPGFSTAETVSELSGRGVGMDVVRRNINELGGSVSISSEPGLGSCISISLPLTLAILDGQLVRAADQTYIIPLVSIIESSLVSEKEINALGGKDQLYAFRGEYLPIIRLGEVMGRNGQHGEKKDGLLVVVEGAGQRYGLWVDELLSQQQVVIKSLEVNLYRVDGVSGATILGDGAVALILDVGGLLNLSRRMNITTPDGTTSNLRIA